jgi:hypothetical protein
MFGALKIFPDLFPSSPKLHSALCLKEPHISQNVTPQGYRT